MKKLLIASFVVVGIIAAGVIFHYRRTSQQDQECSERLVNDSVRVFLQLHAAREALKADPGTTKGIYGYRQHIENAFEIAQRWQGEQHEGRRDVVIALEGALRLYRETVPLFLSVHNNSDDDALALLSVKSKEAGIRLVAVEVAIIKPPGILSQPARQRVIEYLDTVFKEEFQALANDPKRSASAEVWAAVGLRIALNSENDRNG